MTSEWTLQNGRMENLKPLYTTTDLDNLIDLINICSTVTWGSVHKKSPKRKNV